MKKSVFDPAIRAALISRLEKLEGNSIPQWGTMNAAQMVHHLYESTKMATGELILPDKSNLFTRTVLRYFMLSGMVPPKKQLAKKPPQTFDEFNMVKGKIVFTDLNNERRQLITQWEKLNNQTSYPERHPLIGKMNRDNWGQQFYSHAHYHLTQFGV